MAIDINKKTITALDHINNGYVQYGWEELKKTAAMNDLAAQFYVAVCYENGISVEKDLSQAFKMYRKAAESDTEQARAFAQNSVGRCYQFGIGVEPNEKEALLKRIQ